MANSAFSNLPPRANGTLSGSRGRYGRSGADRYGDRYDEYRDNQSYNRGYREPVGSPYDDIDDVSGIGEVRTRAVSSGRYHPPLLSFREARTNNYVDRLRATPYDRSRPTTRRFEHPGASYTPRVRESVNMGYSSEYDDPQANELTSASVPAASSAGAASVPEAQFSVAPGASAQRMSAAGTPISASGFDPFASLHGAGAQSHTPKRRLKVLTPTDYSQAADVARALKAGDAVVLTLAQVPGDLAKRILDFSFGAASALDAGVECVAEKVFVVARGQGLSESERTELRSQGIIK